MSFVLILNSSWTAKHPAVIGGYSTLEEAERAGDLATAFPEPTEGDSMGWYNVPMPFYTSYVVVPGAAASGPIGSVQCRLDRDDGKIVRTKTRS